MKTCIEIDALAAERPWLERVAYRMVHDRDEADDVVQETYLAALRNPPPSDRPTRAWLGRVARNVVRMRHRSATRRDDRHRRADSEVQSPSCFDDILRRQAGEHLQTAIESLDEPFREAILLRFLEDMSIAEIAERQGVPAGTAGWRVHEGLKRVRTELDRIADGDSRPWLAALIPLSPIDAGPPTTTAAAPAKTGGPSMIAKLVATVVLLAAIVGATLTVTASSRASVPMDSVSMPTTAIARATQAAPRSRRSWPGAPQPATPPAANSGPSAPPHFEPLSFSFSFDIDGKYDDSALRRQISDRSADFAPMIFQCYQDLVTAKPEVASRGNDVEITLEIENDGALGGIVAASTYHNEKSTIGDTSFIECIRESSYVLDLDDPLLSNATHEVNFRVHYENREETRALLEESPVRECFDEYLKRNPDAKLSAGRIEDEALNDCILAATRSESPVEGACIDWLERMEMPAASNEEIRRTEAFAKCVEKSSAAAAQGPGRAFQIIEPRLKE